MPNASACAPRSKPYWRPTRGGVVRVGIDEILGVGLRNGIDVDDDLFAWSVDACGLVRPGDFAAYGTNLGKMGNHPVPWARYETFPGSRCVKVLIAADVGKSDDEILAGLIHETIEIRALSERFAANGWQLMAEEIDSLVNEYDGRIHCAAWREADDVLIPMIRAKGWPK